MIVELEAARETLKETSKIARVLLTLPTTYDPVVTAIQTIADDKLTLAFVKTRLLDYEIKLRNERNDRSGKVLQTEVQPQDKSQKQNKGTGKKFNNHRPNFKSKPFNKFTQGFKYQQSQRNQKFKKYHFNNSKNYSLKYEYCGRRNHEKKNCYYYKKMTQNPEDRQRRIQNVQVEDTEGGFAFMGGVGLSSKNSFNRRDKLAFLLDSEATDHLINQEYAFSDATDLPVLVKITVAKKNEVKLATKRGTMNVTTDQEISGILENVLYASEVPYNLLSVRRIQQAGMRAIFHENGITTIEKHNKVIATGEQLADAFTSRYKQCSF